MPTSSRSEKTSDPAGRPQSRGSRTVSGLRGEQEAPSILTACYAAGLRVSEAIALTPPAIDSKRMVLRVEQGKGMKDRYVMLSPKLLEILREWWRVERPDTGSFPAICRASTLARRG